MDAVVLPDVAAPDRRPPWPSARPGLTAWKVCRPCLPEVLGDVSERPDKYGVPVCVRCPADVAPHAGRYGTFDRPDEPCCRAVLRKWAAHWDVVGWPPAPGDEQSERWAA